MKYKIYYSPIEYPELFQIKNVMYQPSSGYKWDTTRPPRNWTSTTIQADTPTEAISKLNPFSFEVKKP